MAWSVLNHPRIFKVESLAKDQHVHYVRLADPSEVDADVRQWLEVSPDYGEQRNRK